jgi:hypothetical protein
MSEKSDTLDLLPTQRLLAALASPRQLHVSAFYNGESRLLRTNDATNVEIAPFGASVKTIFIHNADCTVAAVTVRKDENGNGKACVEYDLKPGETLAYEDGTGWRLLSPNRERFLARIM